MKKIKCQVSELRSFTDFIDLKTFINRRIRVAPIAAPADR